MGKKIFINALMFLAGAATGSLAVYKYLEHRFEIKLEEEIQAVKKYAKKKIKLAEETTPVIYEEEEDDVLLSVTSSSVKLKDLENTGPIIVDGDHINGVYLENKVIFANEDDLEVDLEEEEEDHGFGMPDPPTHAERMKTPFIISPREFSEEMQHFNKVALSYYSGDETFTDDQDELIDDIRLLVGDAYEYFGCNPEDPDIVHVRNYKLGTDFELCRVYGRYSDTVAGHYRTANQEDEYDYE